MKNKISKNNILWSVLIAVQIALLIPMLFHLADRPYRESWTFEENNYVLSGEENSENILNSTLIGLSSGAYKVQIEYLVDNPDDLEAYVEFRSEEQQYIITNSVIPLKEGNTETDARIWVPYGNSIEDLEIVLSSNAFCRVDGVSVSEITGWRYLRLLGFLGFFVIIDGVLYLLRKKDAEGNNIYILGILVIVLLANLPEITNFSHYQHDYVFHLNRILSIEDALFNGAFPVRIHFRLLHGYGFANSIFYGDILLYIPAILYHMGMPLYMAYKCYLIFVNTMTVCIAFWCFEKISADKSAALLGTLVYALAPYRLINMFIRGAVGEYTAMAFMPLAAYGFYSIYKKENNKTLHVADVLPLVLGISGIVESHTLSIGIVMIFAILFCIICIRKTFMPKRFAGLVKAVLLVVCLNAWFIVPFLDYARLPFKYQDKKVWMHVKGLYLSQIFSIFYADLPGTSGIGLSHRMPLLVGGAFLFAGGLFLYLYHKKRECLSKESKIFFGLGTLATFFATVYCPWQWSWKLGEKIHAILNKIQFPWRYLSIAVVCFSFLTVLLWSVLKKTFSKKIIYIYTAVVTGLCVIPTSLFYTDFLNHWEENRYYSESDINSDNIMDDFYLPIGTEIAQLNLKEPVMEDAENGAAVYSCEKSHNNFYITLENASNNMQLLSVPLVNYKGYAAYDRDTGETFKIIDSANHTLQVQIPAGYSGTLKVEFREPWYWRTAEVVSLITILFICGDIIFYKFFRKTKRKLDE